MSNTIHEVFPYLRVRDANAAIEFYKTAFGAEEKFRLSEPGGRIGHAELKFGSFTVMLSDEYPEHGIQSPEAFGGTGSSVHLHVEDVDAMTKQAIEAGAKVLMEPKDMFYGDSVVFRDGASDVDISKKGGRSFLVSQASRNSRTNCRIEPYVNWNSSATSFCDR